MWSRIQAAAPDQVHGLGFANPTLYRVGTGPGYAQDFHDITVGSNGLYAATPGWDYVSGFGSPNLTNLMRDIDGRTAPVHDVPPPAVPAPPLATACDPVWTSPSGNAADPLTGDQIPQLDLTRGDLVLSPDRTRLRVILTVSTLDGNTPQEGTGMSWTMYWTENGTTYFARAQIDRLGAVGFGDGVSNAKGADEAHTDDTGSLTKGSPGRVEIDVPLGHVGTPAPGTRLTYALGEAAFDVGILPATVDIGGTQRDTLLAPCGSAPPPPAVAPPGKPLPLPVTVGQAAPAPSSATSTSGPTAPPPLLPSLPVVPRAVIGVRSLTGALLGTLPSGG